ncbi:MAG: acyltransferase family protein, partial [Flavisolibacter sp.]
MSQTKTTSVYPLHPKEKLFFPNLDALRFFSFLGVFLYHSYKVVFNYLENSHPEFYQMTAFLFQNGNLGVNFFFVLSGFLITFLLLKEKKKSGDIHLRNFYIRRILRIWPLFYLCVFTGFVIFPFFKSMAGATPSETANLLYYLLFINNFDFIHHWPQVPDALILVVLWSVAVEEQFYLAWPVIVKLVKNILLPLAFALVIIASLIFRYFHSSNTDEDYGIRYFHTLSVIGDMAIGGLLAYY